jgi:prolyl-tRNA synthetase
MVDPNAKLEEELIVRPTSEAIIWSTYKGGFNLTEIYLVN